jgi:hypothetical protein
MRTASEILPIVDGWSQRDIENWIARLDLSTSFQGAGRGKARLFNRANTLELAFIAALVQGGASPSKAAVYARSLVRDVQHPTGKPVREWLIFAPRNLQKAVAVDDLTKFASIQRQLDAVTLAVVSLGEIVRRVNALYEEGAH